LVALDFDGTLSLIVSTPEDARAVPGAADVLAALASRVRRLAILTGRPADLVVELGGLSQIPGLVVLGHYGMQRWENGELTSPAPVAGIATARAALPGLLAPGVRLEDKELSLVLHTRQAPDPDSAYEALRQPLAELAERCSLELVPGRAVWELRPAGIDKGGALTALVAEVGAQAVFIGGDDLGDLPMFAAARELGISACCVAVHSGGAAPEVAAAADLVVEGPEGMVALLRELL